MVAVVSCLGVWVWTLAVCLGWGLGVRRCWATEPLRARELGLCAWLGYALLLLGLQAWHLLAPIDTSSFVWLSVVGLAGLATCFNEVRTAWAELTWRRNLLILIGLALGVFLALRARGPDAHYDTGLYYLQAMRWAHEQPLTPGLGNLDGRLAFNNSHFLYAAWIQSCGWAVSARQTANGALIWLLLLQMGVNAALLSERRLASRVFTTLLLPVVFYLLAFGVNLASPSPDLPIFALQIVIAELLLRAHEDSRERTALFSTAVGLLAVAAVTIKLSCAVFSLLAFALALYYVRKTVSRAVLGGMALAAGMFLLWAVRGVGLSGYPFFPSTIGALNPDWAVPAETAEHLRDVVRAYGRQPGAEWSALKDGAWFRPWCARVWQDHKLLIVLPLAGTFAALTMARFTRPARDESTPLFLIPAAFSAGIWFGLSPEPRFAGSVFLILCAGSVAFALEAWLIFVPRRIWQAWAVAATGALTLLVLIKGQPLIFPAGENQGFHSHAVVKMKVVKTDSGLELNVPESGDQVWDAPLPATPAPNPRLRMRESGVLRAGFSVGGK